MSAEVDALVALIYAELERQEENPNIFDRPYVSSISKDGVVGVDGQVDLTAIAKAILAGQQGEGVPDGPALVWAEYLHKDWMLNMNQRLHFRAKNNRVQSVKTIGRNRSRNLPRLDRARLDITVAYPAAFSADVHNYMPTAKAFVDGLINIPDTVKGMKKQPSRGILTDDSDEYLLGPYLHAAPGKSPRKDHFVFECVLQPLKKK